ncbi:vacuolar protein [Kwoniella mangroviensis CBS 10435]|uniref:Vacuolar protein n=1 Tax=Kwoniella mangroviensis CBS 10435 TaxID=1331196 RepID=A0A1B9IXY1_9TREE|nr:vacuolar protein [Kwoniella mangroviensis CBS 10435]
MPARDPATSPHLPTNLPQPQPSHSPILPTHQQQHPQQPRPLSPDPSASASASSFSLRSAESPTPDQQGGTSYFSKVFRSVSISHSQQQRPMGNDLNSDAGIPNVGMHSGRRISNDFHQSGNGNNSHNEDRIGLGNPPHNHSSNTPQSIRDSTARLASLSFSSRNRATSSAGDSSFSHFQPSVSPLASRQAPSSSTSIPKQQPAAVVGKVNKPVNPSHLNPAIAIGQKTSPSSDESNVNGTGVSPYAGQRSGLSMMLERAKEAESTSNSASTSTSAGDMSRRPPSAAASDNEAEGERTPVPSRKPLIEVDSEVVSISSSNSRPSSKHASASSLRRYLADEVAREDVERANANADENTPLLANGNGSEGKKKRSWASRSLSDVKTWKNSLSKVSPKDVAKGIIVEPIKTIPSVVLGLLLNVLDGVSYGMILFPANAVFVDFGSLGVSMFFVSCIVSQLVFSLGGSIFPGGNGSMMIEAVPFFHILVNTFEAVIGDDDKAIIATTMVAFAFSSILTGLVFFALGAFKLGGLIGYFPRHILVGCIGGVGIFLIETGLEVSRGLKEEGFEYNLATLKLFFESGHVIALWTIPLALAILLRIISHFFHHQLIFPAYFFVVPLIFYGVVLIGRWDLDYLRQTGWVFDVGKNTQSWWKFYTYFDFRKTHWGAFWEAMPTQLALVFFGILHVPLNVPALGVSLAEDNVKLDRELVAHGFSNLAAGLVGTVPNYLTYVNTVLFYRVGGGSRLSGLLLAAATAAIMMVGPSVIAALPVMVVGALIFVLGIDLVIEAVWDTRNRVNKWEYITIWVIAIGMTIFDFVIGLLLGIILACIFFVVQSSRRRAIRTVFNGATARSTVRRPKSQREFIQQVGSQTYVMKLQGFLFFGTITYVESEIRHLLDLAKWQHDPIRFLIIDLHLVHGMDFSSAEAFVRVQRLLAAKDVLLILCGAAPNGLVGTALQAVDLWADREGTRVEVFVGLNDALEWTENAYLTAFYENQRLIDQEASTAQVIDFPKIAKPPFSLAESFQNSPRRSHLVKAGGDTLPRSTFPSPPKPEPSSLPDLSTIQPLQILYQTFEPYLEYTSSSGGEGATKDSDFHHDLVPFFKREQILSGDTLWTQNDLADGLYLIESGCLRATYAYDDHTNLVQETMVAGTIAGDLSTLSEMKRNCTVVAERDCVLWKMDVDSLSKLENENTEVARKFIKIVLKAVAEEHEVLTSHLIAVLS